MSTAISEIVICLIDFFSFSLLFSLFKTDYPNHKTRKTNFTYISYQNKQKQEKALKLSADKPPSILHGVFDKSHIGSAGNNEIGSDS
jgi:hypothetical protein